MTKQMMMILGAGLFISVLVALMVQNAFSSKTAEDDGQTAYILVASNDISLGEEFDSLNVRWQPWPKNALTANAIVQDPYDLKVDEAIIGRAIRKIYAGEPLNDALIIDEDANNVLAASLKPGMRALAIKVSAESSVGGFVLPDDYVDVIMTYAVKVPNIDGLRKESAAIINKSASQTVLENVRVLAVDQEAKAKDAAKVGRTVTLEVGKRGAEILSLAETMGDLSLALRSSRPASDTVADAEINSVLTTDIFISNVLKYLTEEKINNADNAGTVRVYNGGTMNKQTVRMPSSSQTPSQLR